MPTEVLTGGRTAPPGEDTEVMPKVGLRDRGALPIRKVKPADPGPVSSYPRRSLFPVSSPVLLPGPTPPDPDPDPPSL